MDVVVSTATAEETRGLGEAIASLLQPGDVVSLTGEPGAGKTTFVQGVARGLDVARQVVSPTFTLVREYEGRLPVFHVDVYRLKRIQDVIDLGFEEMVDGGGVTLIEWGDVIEELLDPGLQVEITLAESEERRRLRFTPAGKWEPRLADLQEATQGWSE